MFLYQFSFNKNGLESEKGFIYIFHTYYALSIALIASFNSCLALSLATLLALEPYALTLSCADCRRPMISVTSTLSEESELEGAVVEEGLVSSLEYLEGAVVEEGLVPSLEYLEGAVVEEGLVPSLEYLDSESESESDGVIVFLEGASVVIPS